METGGADSLAETLKAGKLVTLLEMTSIATSIGYRRVAAKTFGLAQSRCVKRCGSMMRRRQWAAAD